MATITWYAGEGSNVYAVNNSGLGFYGAAGFGSSVSVGSWNERTFITNSGGTAMGPEADNCRHHSITGVILGQTGSPLTLNRIPNYQATVNVRFEHTSAVKVQNASFRTYDRASISNPATGVTVAVYEVSHVGTSQDATGSGGPGTPIISGAHGWTYMSPTGHAAMPLTASPGTSGLSPSGSNTVDTRHDWFLSLSTSPDSAGSKLFAGWISLEYL